MGTSFSSVPYQANHTPHATHHIKLTHTHTLLLFLEIIHIPKKKMGDGKLVDFVVIPLILLSAIVVILNQKPSPQYPWTSPPRHFTLHSPAPAPAPPPPPPSAEKQTPPPPSAEKQTPPVVEEMIKKYGKLDMVEAGLAQARANILRNNNETSLDPDYVPQAPFYRNPKAFHRSYLEMEKGLKIYIYEEGEPPLFHYSKSLGILGMEGIIMHQMEITKFRTRDPEKAHLFFIPLSVQSIVDYSYDHNRAWDPIQNIARDYIKLISTHHPYWNRTQGRDHFIIGCHDWTPTVSHGVEKLYKNSIRVLCNANTSEGFKPSTDVSMPEIYLPKGTTAGLIGGPPPANRSILVFYAGGVHGYIREVLMEKWKDKKDPEVQIHEYLPKTLKYYDMMRKSKYCICPSGWEVASPRMVEAIYMGCVPVLLKEHYAKPFDDVLDWSEFGVEMGVKDIPELKEILKGIRKEKYMEMQRNGEGVRRHFEVNFPPKRYDVFHMILHSMWLRRINIQLHPTFL